MRTSLAQVGDIIKGNNSFIFGRVFPDRNDGAVYVGAPEKNIGQLSETLSALIDGQVYTRTIQTPIDYSRHDSTRDGALFVVERAFRESGGTDDLAMNVYVDALHVYARRLNPAGKYDSAGELISFYQDGGLDSLIREVEVVGKMRLVFEPCM